MEMYTILVLILIANILQLSYTQKVISFVWVEARWTGKVIKQFISKLARRLFYSIKDFIK